MHDVIISRSLTIPASDIRFVFSRSGGKGGQNVNKVETKVELLFDVKHSPSLTDDLRDQIAERLRSRFDSDGVLHVVAQTSRSQWANREAAIAKFVHLLRRAIQPRKKRIRTRVPAAAKERRLEEKKRRGEVKRLRGNVG